MSRFFIVIPPGFEAIAELELMLWLRAFSHENDIALARERGGLSLDLPLEIGFALNRYLKVPSRIILRLADFKCRDFPKLYKKFRGLDWSPWIFPDAPVPEFSVSSHRSRLAIKKRILSACEEGYLASPTGKGAVASETADRNLVLVRIIDDVCTISLDTSGEHLHKRGYKLHTTEAPLRENLAASLLLELCAQKAILKDTVLIDPMLGSGTFLTEAGRLGLENAREFAFQKFNCVRSGEKQIPTVVAPPQELPVFEKLIGFDTSNDALKAARENIKSAGLEKRAELFEADAFLQEKAQLPEGTRVLVCNPPYGERIKIKGSLALHYSKLLSNFAFRFSPEIVGVILPEKVNLKSLHLPESWKLEGQTAFENGGLPVSFYRFTCV